MSAITWLGVACFGGLGALGRFVLDGLISARIEHNFPLGTSVINVSGAFALGLVTGLAFRGDALLLAGAATLGSYTTFSTWMLETHRLREEAKFSLALANTLISLIAGFGAAAIGRSIAGHL